jgi:hypothetical protein
MPGSPPINTTPPGTMPPPSTRSSSAMPVVMRGIFSALISESSCTLLLAVRPLKRLPLEAVSAIVSTKVFHALQWGHWPCQRKVWPPHSVQVKTDFVLANKNLSQHL